MKSSAKKIELASVDDLFSTEESRQDEQLEEHPELVNQDPYGEGWIIKLKPTDASELDDLLDAARNRCNDPGEVYLLDGRPSI